MRATDPNEPQWRIDARTIRDCPGGRTEDEWWRDVRALEEKLSKGAGHCPTCGASRLSRFAPYIVTETEAWVPSESDLPRQRAPIHVHAYSYHHARTLAAFLGPRATIRARTQEGANSASYERVVKRSSRGRK